MTGIEAKLAVAAVKPATGFINAWLAPKVKTFEKWLNDHELKSNADSGKLSKIIEDYLTKLAYRVEEITSIAFPLRKLKLDDNYEPLALERLHRSDKDEPPVGVDTFTKSQNGSFVIVDNAGMGKSIFSKYLVSRFLFKSDRIPILFELRKIDSEIDLLDNLAKELDLPGELFCRALFFKLVKLGKFVVILDGFDEVAIEHQQPLANQIHQLSDKGGNNLLVLTSRPQDALPDLVNGISLKFKTFTLAQAQSLVLRYDKTANIDVGQRLIAEIEQVPTKFLQTPLLVSLLYRTFGVNNAIADRTCTFYDEVYHALYKGHDLTNKSGYAREKKSAIDFEDFRRLLRALCYFMAISRKTAFNSWSEAIAAIDKAMKISSIKPTSASNFLDDLLVAVPLMFKEGNEYKFLHKTILEYFAAEYIVFDNNSAALVEKIFHSKSVGAFDKVFDFLHDLKPTLFDAVITSHFAKKVLELDIGDSLCSKALHSIVLSTDCEIALDTNKIKDPGRAALSHIRISSHNNDLKYLCISYGFRKVKFHRQAWLSITEKLTAQSRVIEIEQAEALAKVIGIDSWSTLDENLIKKVENHDFLLNVAALVLHGNTIRTSIDLNYRILSQEKAKQVLERVQAESDVEKEMALLLD